MDRRKSSKKLNIEDFRHITKDKVITMSSMLDKMDPEVDKKHQNSFTEFAKVTKEILV